MAVSTKSVVWRELYVSNELLVSILRVKTAEIFVFFCQFLAWFVTLQP
jgi:hypothetical protein